MVELRTRVVNDNYLREIDWAVGAALDSPWKYVIDLLDEVRRLKGVVETLVTEYDPPDSVLTAHGRAELQRAGYYDGYGEKNSAVASAVIRLLQDLSLSPLTGMDIELVLDAFDRLARGETLLSITAHPSEWADRTEAAGYALWQNKHDPRVLSTDGGATWFYTEKTAPDQCAAVRDMLIGGGIGVGAVLGCKKCQWRQEFGVIDLPLLIDRAQTHRAACPSDS